MVTMKALGYSNKETVINTILIPGFIATIFVIGGYILGKWLLGTLMVQAQQFGIFIPLITNWWATPLILIGIIIMFILAFSFSLRKPMKDFIVIGAGFAGLQAGLELKKNKDFIIIEPREVVGGRVFNDYFKNDTVVELGVNE